MPRIPFRGPLLVIAMVCGGGALAAGTLAIRHAASKTDTPEAVAMQMRQAQAGTCEGYNLELASAAASQTRMGRHDEASRLLSMRQACGVTTHPVIRSAR